MFAPLVARLRMATQQRLPRWLAGASASPGDVAELTRVAIVLTPESTAEMRETAARLGQEWADAVSRWEAIGARYALLSGAGSWMAHAPFRMLLANDRRELRAHVVGTSLDHPREVIGWSVFGRDDLAEYLRPAMLAASGQRLRA
ncbi:MAG: hypothetical protein JSR54_12275 [Proteobacteria bacterium]|nr:hypothetical protein [Pseudomonadota bacterium]